MHLEGAGRSRPTSPISSSGTSARPALVGLTWSRANDFGEGVPFGFPGSPDTGPGLTQAGSTSSTPATCSGILVDVSHLNEAGFWDVARITPGAARRDALERARALPLDPQPHRPPAGRDRRLRRGRGRQLLPAVPARGRPVRRLELARLRSCAISTTSPRGSASITSRSAPISRAPRSPKISAGSQASRGCSTRCARPGTTGEALEQITHGNWLRVLGETLAALGALLPRRRPRSPPDAARCGRPVPGPRVRGRSRRRHRPRHARAAATRLAGARDRPGNRGDRAAERARRRRRRPAEHRGRPLTSEASWPACELVNASFALPFCPPAEFPGLWRRIVDSILPGGRFAGQFFGPNDDWARTGLLVQTRAELERAACGRSRSSCWTSSRASGRPRSARASTGTFYHVVARKRG